jgi:hypothetical protein
MNKILLSENVSLLQEISNSIYTAFNPVLNGNLAGHFRHIIEYYNVFFEGLEKGEIIYSARKRDKSIENSCKNAIVAIENIQKNLICIQHSENIPVRIADDLPDNEEATILSNLSRELLAVYTHTIHHNAIIKMGILTIAPETKMPKNFGIAPSTIAFHQQKNSITI